MVFDPKAKFVKPSVSVLTRVKQRLIHMLMCIIASSMLMIGAMVIFTDVEMKFYTTLSIIRMCSTLVMIAFAACMEP